MQAPTPKKHALSSQISHGEWTERQVTLFDQEFVPEAHELVVHLDVFSERGRLSAVRQGLQSAGLSLSPTCVGLDAGTAGGLQVRSLEGISAVPVVDGGRVVGLAFEDSFAIYCLLGGLYPSDPTASPAVQTEEIFEMIERALAGSGMDFRHVVRTWFYNDHILEWYADFNRVRTRFFQEHGITLMPASTGIGAPNIEGAALVAKVIAVLPKTDAIQIRKAESPLQCDAFAYGSAFSRAIEVAGPNARTLYISGTASIEPGGKTVHVGAPALQIAKTMEVVAAILGAAGMDYGDTTRAVAYFRNPADVALWREFCRAACLSQLPVIEASCTICRDDLLFEIELEAACST